MPLQLGGLSPQRVEFSRGLFGRQAVQIPPVAIAAADIAVVGVAHAHGVVAAAGGSVRHHLEAASCAIVAVAVAVAVAVQAGDRNGGGSRAARNRRFAGDASS